LAASISDAPEFIDPEAAQSRQAAAAMAMSDPSGAPMTFAADQRGEVAASAAQATAQINARHREETSALQQAVDRLTAVAGRPGFVAALGCGIAIWIAANLSVAGLGLRPVDPPPFSWLQGAASTGALLVAALILTTQRREDQLANHRAQLIMELSILNDRKISKIIELLEEGRRDNPALSDRVDNQATAMSTPSDAHAVMEAIKETHAALNSTAGERLASIELVAAATGDPP
jgi:uncharacterized membrane protein